MELTKQLKILEDKGYTINMDKNTLVVNGKDFTYEATIENMKPTLLPELIDSIVERVK